MSDCVLFSKGKGFWHGWRRSDMTPHWTYDVKQAMVFRPADCSVLHETPVEGVLIAVERANEFLLAHFLYASMNACLKFDDNVRQMIEDEYGCEDPVDFYEFIKNRAKEYSVEAYQSNMPKPEGTAK